MGPRPLQTVLSESGAGHPLLTSGGPGPRLSGRNLPQPGGLGLWAYDVSKTPLHSKAGLLLIQDEIQTELHETALGKHGTGEPEEEACLRGPGSCSRPSDARPDRTPFASCKLHVDLRWVCGGAPCEIIACVRKAPWRSTGGPCSGGRRVLYGSSWVGLPLDHG